MQILQPSAAELGLTLEHVLLGGAEHAVKPPQYGERQDHVLVLASLEGVPDQVRDSPNEVNNFTVVHLFITGRCCLRGNIILSPLGWRFPACHLGIFRSVVA